MTFFLLVFIAFSCANFFATLFYARIAMRGAIAPNRITWFFWALAPLIGASAMLVKGETYAAVPVLTAGIGPLVVLVSTFSRRAMSAPLSRIDIWCGVCALSALILWAITKEPLVAIMFAIGGDACAAIPTVVKSWKHPESEKSWPFSTGILAALATFLVVEQYTLSAVLFPAYLVCLNMLLVVVIHRNMIRTTVRT